IRRTWGEGRAGARATAVRETEPQDQYGGVDLLQGGRGIPDDLCDQAVGGYTKKGFPRFLDLLHRRLDGPVTLVWEWCSASFFRRYTSAASAGWDGGNLRRRSPSQMTISTVTYSTTTSCTARQGTTESHG
ncbi:hypothetical protein, partial [Streptomyces sp. NPDC055085]